jgi:hypothetical protein
MPRDRELYRRNVEAAILSCVEVRRAAETEADHILRNHVEYAIPAVRADAIRRTFDGADEQQRRLPEIMDEVRGRRNSNAPNP